MTKECFLVIFFAFKLKNSDRLWPVDHPESGFLLSFCVSLLCMHNHTILYNTSDAEGTELAQLYVN